MVTQEQADNRGEGMFNEEPPEAGDRRYTIVVTGDGEFLVGTCVELGVSAQGGTREGCLENLREAIALFLDDEPIVLPAKVVKALTAAGYHGVNKRGRHIKFRKYGSRPDTLVLPNETRLARHFIDLVCARTGCSPEELQGPGNGTES